MTEVVVIAEPEAEPVAEAEAVACCEHCEGNRDAIAGIIAGQLAAAEISEDAALEGLAELLELDEIADEPSGSSPESD
jgi:hypothetical protein